MGVILLAGLVLFCIQQVATRQALKFTLIGTLRDWLSASVHDIRDVGLARLRAERGPRMLPLAGERDDTLSSPMSIEYVVFGVIVAAGIGAAVVGTRRRRADMLADDASAAWLPGDGTTGRADTHVGHASHDGGFHGGFDGGGSHHGGGDGGGHSH